MKNVKKLLALGLSVAMVLGMVACGNDTPATTSESKTTIESTANKETSDLKEEMKEPVTLEWWYSGNGIQKDTEKVEGAFNELLKTYPGMEHVTVNFNCYTHADYANQVLLAQSAEQQIDILQTYKLSFTNEAENGTFMALNDYLEDYTDLKNELPDWLWDLGTVDGNIYIVPNFQRASNMSYIVFPKEYVDKYGDIEKLTKVLGDDDRTLEAVAEVLEEFYLAVSAGEEGTKYMPPISSMILPKSAGFNPRGDHVGLKNVFLPLGSDTLRYSLIGEDAQACYELSAEWYKKGYIHPDFLTVNQNDFNGANMLNDISYLFTVVNGAGDAEAIAKQYSDAYGFEVIAIPESTNYFIENSWAAGGNGVTAKCENPEEAVRLLELLNTEEGAALYNMVTYGIEGVHYEKIDDTHIKTLEYDGTQGGIDTSYAAMKWKMGNTVYAYLNQGCAENENTLAKEINEGADTLVSKIMGFVPKTASVTTQIEQVSAITTEYENTLSGGVMGDNWKNIYDEYVKKLESAGLHDIIDELQKQIDEYLATK